MPEAASKKYSALMAGKYHRYALDRHARTGCAFAVAGFLAEATYDIFKDAAGADVDET